VPSIANNKLPYLGAPQSAESMSSLDEAFRGLQAGREDRKSEDYYMAGLQSEDAVATATNLYAKISIGLVFMVFLFLVLGLFHWYFNRKYSEDTENAIASYIADRNESRTVQMELEEDAVVVARRLRLIREVGKSKFHVKEEDILSEDEMMALSQRSNFPLKRHANTHDVEEGVATIVSSGASSPLKSPPRKSPLLVRDEFHDVFLDSISDASASADTYLRLPSSRVVRNCCSVCIAPYNKGDSAVWSSNPQCPHVYHFDCILRWLCQRDANLCPMCRQAYVQLESDKKDKQKNDPERTLDSSLNDGERNQAGLRRMSVVTDDATLAEDTSHAGHCSNSMRSELAVFANSERMAAASYADGENNDGVARRQMSLPGRLNEELKIHSLIEDNVQISEPVALEEELLPSQRRPLVRCRSAD